MRKIESTNPGNVYVFTIETNNNICAVQGKSSGVKLTRFEIEGGLELIGMPFVNIMH